jgi:hypothetical protein
MASNKIRDLKGEPARGMLEILRQPLVPLHVRHTGVPTQTQPRSSVVHHQQMVNRLGSP